jgi:hypothetical protein
MASIAAVMTSFALSEGTWARAEEGMRRRRVNRVPQTTDHRPQTGSTLFTGFLRGKIDPTMALVYDTR